MTDNNARPTTGRWAVTTEHSSYLIDLDEKWIERNPDHEAAADLRRDTERLPLVHLMHLKVGDPAVMVISIREDVDTVRRTTPVLKIEGGAS